VSLTPIALPLDLAIFMERVGTPRTKGAALTLAAHFRAQVTKLQAKIAGLEQAARRLDEGVPMPVKPPQGHLLNWPDRDAMTIPAGRIAHSVHGIDTPDQPGPGFQDHAVIAGNLRIHAEEYGATLSWNESWQSEPLGFHLCPMDEQDGKRMAAALSQLAKALILAGKLASYQAQVPADRVCSICLEQPVRPARGKFLAEIKQYRGTDTCSLCHPVVERALAMGLKSVKVWNGHVVKLQSQPSDEVLEKTLDSL